MLLLTSLTFNVLKYFICVAHKQSTLFVLLTKPITTLRQLLTNVKDKDET